MKKLKKKKNDYKYRVIESDPQIETMKVFFFLFYNYIALYSLSKHKEDELKGLSEIVYSKKLSCNIIR